MLKAKLGFLLIFLWGSGMFGKNAEVKSEEKSYAQPIIFESSQYYYVPQLNRDSKSSSLSYSYSGSGSDIGVDSRYFFGNRNCNYANVILIDKIHLKKKLLFEKEVRIESFFILDSKQTKLSPDLSKLIFIVSKAKIEDPRRLSVVQFDGTGMKSLTPDNLDVTALDFDLKRGRAFVLLKKMEPKESPTLPYMIDLKTGAQAVPLID